MPLSLIHISGDFDITIAPVMDAWGFTTEERHVPAPDALAAAMALVDSAEPVSYTHLDVYKRQRYITIQTRSWKDFWPHCRFERKKAKNFG